MNHPVVPDLAKVMQVMTPDLVESMEGTNPQAVSERTARFDVPEKMDGINRIKITAVGEKFMLRFYRVEEIDILYEIPPENVSSTIKRRMGGSE